MWRIVLGLFLIAHGLIHFSLTTLPAATPGGPATPFWPGWWRADSGSTWLVTVTGMNNSAVRAFGGLLCIAVTVGFVLAGLGLMGVPLLDEWWRALAVASAAFALPLFVLFWHPWLVLGAALNISVLVSLLWANWPSTDFAG
jgi:hypothetical protein